MKLLIKYLFIFLIAFYTTSCDDFFITNPDDLINSDDYISAESEIYSGYLGLITKMQDMGDNAIFLTDTRGNYLEPTRNTPQALIDIYNYADLTGNEYADPINYYALIIACNDYLHKMFEYKDKLNNAMETTTETHFKALVSSTIRIKVWTYLRLGQIYGEAIWLDDPLIDIESLTNFATINTDELLNRCLDLLDNGVNGIDGTLVMRWDEYLNPEDPKPSNYLLWYYMTPDWLCLRCEILLWQGTGYEWIRENVLNRLSEYFTGNYLQGSSSSLMRLNAEWTSNYARIFSDGKSYTRSEVSSIIYDYDEGQLNRVIKYFSNTYPNIYYLKPSSYGVTLYTDNPDSRRAWGSAYHEQNRDTVMARYHLAHASNARPAYKSDVTIKIFRAHDYHFFLAEAENALGNWDECKTILNNGVGGRFTSSSALLAAGWDERYADWFSSGYHNLGICGCINAGQYDLPTPEDTDYNLTEEERIYIYDMALLDEMMREFVCEGRSYGMLIRMARKYNDYTIITDRILPKYPEEMREEIKNKILSGGYYVKWNY